MTNTTMDWAGTPTIGRDDSEKHDRVVAFTVRVAPATAREFAADLSRAIESVAVKHGLHHIQGPVVLSRETEMIAEVAITVVLTASDREMNERMICVGDVVKAWDSGTFLDRVLAVTPVNEFGDGPYIDGTRGRLDFISLPRTEVERALWELAIGDETEYWCEPRVDKNGRRHRSPWHSKGATCAGLGQWHRARITEIEWRDAGTDSYGFFAVEGCKARPNTLSCVVSTSPEDLLRFEWAAPP